MPGHKRKSQRVNALERNLSRCVDDRVIGFMKRRYDEAFKLLEDD